MRESKEKPKEKRRRLLRGAISVFIGVGLFAAGWAYGGGKLNVRQFNPVSSNSGLPERLDLSSVDTMYKSLRDNFDGELDEAKLLEGIKAGLARATGDPYTEYFNPEDAEDFQSSIDGTFEGIGAELGKDASDNIVIVSPIAGYPAEKAGLRPKDVIAEVDGESTAGWTISQAVDKIRGDKGTTVTLTLVRGQEVKEVPIKRERIDIPSVNWEIRDGIGIMTVIRFGSDTDKLSRQAAQEFKERGVRGVVLDLRGNPGGYLESAVNLSSLWLEPGTTVLTERRDNVVMDTKKARGTAYLRGIKTVVLINEGSASASEIVAGALKDNNAAVTIGQNSYGKGSVQQPVNLKDGGLLKVTIARWFTPGGKNIDKEGIEPDEKVDISEEDIVNNRDPQLDAALSKLKAG